MTTTPPSGESAQVQCNQCGTVVDATREYCTSCYVLFSDSPPRPAVADAPLADPAGTPLPQTLPTGTSSPPTLPPSDATSSAPPWSRTPERTDRGTGRRLGLILGAVGLIALGVLTGVKLTSSDHNTGGTAETAASVGPTSTATEIGDAIGCSDLTPSVDEGGHTGNGLTSPIAVRFTIGGSLATMSDTVATCYLGVDQVLIFQAAGPELASLAVDVPATMEDCHRGDQWTLLVTPNAVVTASSGDPDRRYAVAEAAQSAIGGDLQRATCDPSPSYGNP